MLKKVFLVVAAFYAGVLFAPKSGADTRKELSKTMKAQAEKIKESMKK